jgi:type I restriction enzyme S subunit
MQQLLTGKKRLPGFSGEWKEVKLGDIFDERNETNRDDLPLLSITGDKGVIYQSESDKSDISNDDKSKYNRICPNDIGYNTMRMWQGAEGVSVYDGIVSPAYTVVFSRAAIDVFYFEKYFKTNKMLKTFERYSQGLTSDTWNLKYPAFSKIRVYYPKDLVEQQQIASFFRSMDSQISLQEARLEKLKQIKSACLDKMFV